MAVDLAQHSKTRGAAGPAEPREQIFEAAPDIPFSASVPDSLTVAASLCEAPIRLGKDTFGKPRTARQLQQITTPNYSSISANFAWMNAITAASSARRSSKFSERASSVRCLSPSIMSPSR